MTLTIHTQRLDDCLPLLERTRPPWILAIDPSRQAAEKVKALGITLVVRHAGPWDNGTPERVISPADYVAECQRQAWWDAAGAITTPNEPHPGDVAWMAAVVHFLRLKGKKCVVGAWGTGWDGFYVPGATLYACHEYGWPAVLSQAPWHALRYRSWFQSVLQRNPEAKLLITEMGVTRAVTGGADIGWRSDGRSASEYAQQLSDYSGQLEQDPYVLAACVYQFGGFADWSSFEALGVPELEALIGGPNRQGERQSEEETTPVLGTNQSDKAGDNPDLSNDHQISEDSMRTQADIDNALNLVWASADRLEQIERAILEDATGPSLGQQLRDAFMVLKETASPK